MSAPLSLTTTFMHRSFTYVQRGSAAVVLHRRAPARALSASALVPEVRDVADTFLTLGQAQTGSVQKPARANSVQDSGRVAEPLHPLDVLASAPVASSHHLRPPVNFSSGPSGEPEPERAPQPEQNGDDAITDQEWEIRTGRAIYILQQTLPGFFHTGLITALETPLVRPPDPAGAGGGDPHREGRLARPGVESIYSRHIRLAYTPMHPLPAPLPRTLTIEGSALYLASSAFVRHTLNALYTDLRVNITRVRVLGPASSSGGGRGGLQQEAGGARASQKPRSLREKSLFLGLSVSGVARVSGARGGWDVNSTYAFSPRTGLIHLHKIDSIEPAPTQAVFDALRAALAKLGLASGDDSQAPGAPGAARTQPVPAKSP